MSDMEWWRGAVIYQLYPRSFRDADGDGIGDLNGITGKLDYIAALGVDAIWLSPVYRSPMKDFGYDVSDYKAIDPSFGTLADFDRLVGRAHDLGLKVLTDQVWSHSSDEHPWFRASRVSRHNPHADWYVWADPKPDGTPPNNWLSVFGGPAWRWEPRRRQYYLHHFLTSQPQLNHRNPAVLDALEEIGRFWLDRGVDGFRLDAIDFLMHDHQLRDNPARPPEGGIVPAKLFGLQHHVHDMLQPECRGVLSRIRRLMDAYPGRTTLAEISSQDGAFERVASYTDGSALLHMAYTLRPLRGDFDAQAVRQLLSEITLMGDQGWIAWSFSNHDVARAVTRWSPYDDRRRDPRFAKLLLGLLLSLRGSICLYQGDELGLPDSDVAQDDMQDPFGIAYYPEFRGRDGSRTPMPWMAAAPNAGFTDAGLTNAAKPWLPIDPAHVMLSVDRQEGDPHSVLNACRSLLRWRRNEPALIHGRLEILATDDPIIAFRRRWKDRNILVALNLSDRPAPLPKGFSRSMREIQIRNVPEWRLDGLDLGPWRMVFGEEIAAPARVPIRRVPAAMPA